MTLYEAVYTRKSIRNFRKDKVETSILEGMIQFYHEMEPLFPGDRDQHRTDRYTGQ